MTSEEIIRVQIPGTLKYLHVLGVVIDSIFERVKDLKEKEVLVYKLKLAVQELGTNIVKHAYNGGNETKLIEVVFILQAEPRRFVVETQDSGISLFDPDEIPPPGLDVAQTHGYGLFLIRALVDDVSCQLKKGHNRWRLVKELE